MKKIVFRVLIVVLLLFALLAVGFTRISPTVQKKQALSKEAVPAAVQVEKIINGFRIFSKRGGKFTRFLNITPRLPKPRGNF